MEIVSELDVFSATPCVYMCVRVFMWVRAERTKGWLEYIIKNQTTLLL